jgi:hypothetical protein
VYVEGREKENLARTDSSVRKGSDDAAMVCVEADKMGMSVLRVINVERHWPVSTERRGGLGRRLCSDVKPRFRKEGLATLAIRMPTVLIAAIHTHVFPVKTMGLRPYSAEVTSTSVAFPKVVLILRALAVATMTVVADAAAVKSLIVAGSEVRPVLATNERKVMDQDLRGRKIF